MDEDSASPDQRDLWAIPEDKVEPMLSGGIPQEDLSVDQGPADRRASLAAGIQQVPLPSRCGCYEKTLMQPFLYIVCRWRRRKSWLLTPLRTRSLSVEVLIVNWYMLLKIFPFPRQLVSSTLRMMSRQVVATLLHSN